MLLGSVLLVGGIALVLWGAERFTDGALRAATRFGLSTFWIGAVVSGFEPENLVTGVTASAEGLPQIALGTVIGSAIFLLTGGLGVALLLVPMEVRVPREGSVAMVTSLVAFALALWTGGTVSRLEGALLVLTAIGLMVWLYRRSPVFLGGSKQDADTPARASGVRAVGILVIGGAVMVAGAELVVHGVRGLLDAVRLSQTFLGMAVVGLGESLEETARMVTPARRGHPELAWGNVVGTVVTLLTFNLGVIALVQPVVVDPLVLRLHAPYLLGCTILVAAALAWASRLGRPMGVTLVALYVLYLGLNVAHMWD
ncbi:MAG TPA: sodium:calcium antiporter [Methylomirabilota bacterium]|nr:sodium:calcium antiporter [Methylomirabilota bacterium]